MTRPYLNAKQLEELTPWSRKAIDQMIRRGVLVRGVHWFQPFGPETQIVFKWEPITALIEGAGGPVERAEARGVEAARRRDARAQIQDS